MPASTPGYGFPYPTGTDRVMDGDNAIGALAQSVEDTISSIRAVRAELTADLVLPTSHANLAGCNVTAETTEPEIWIAWGTYDFQVTGASAGALARGGLVLDGIEYPQIANLDTNATGRATVSQLLVTPVLAPGTHVIQLRAWKTTSGPTVTASAAGGSTNLVVLRIPASALGAAARPGDDDRTHAPDSEPAI